MKVIWIVWVFVIKSHTLQKITLTESERKKQIKQEKNRQKRFEWLKQHLTKERLVKIQARRKNKKEGNE